MNNGQRIVGIPPIGIFTEHFTNFFERLGLKVLKPIPITEETIKLGVKHSPELFCYPYKVVLGNFIQLIEAGANTLVMFSSCGKCKQRHYYKLAEQKLRREGYEFEMIKIAPIDLIPLPLPGLLNRLSYISGLSKPKIAKAVLDAWGAIAKTEKGQKKERGEINIGVTGEIFCVLEPDVNLDLISKLEGMGATVHTTLSLREVITHTIWRTKERRELRKQCWQYLDKGGDPGGHGLHSVEDTILWSEMGMDGVIHLTPLSCHPEIVVEDAVDYICKDNKIPLLRIKLDETMSPLNMTTRVETFYELIKRRKKKNGKK